MSETVVTANETAAAAEAITPETPPRQLTDEEMLQLVVYNWFNRSLAMDMDSNPDRLRYSLAASKAQPTDALRAEIVAGVRQGHIINIRSDMYNPKALELKIQESLHGLQMLGVDEDLVSELRHHFAEARLVANTHPAADGQT